MLQELQERIWNFVESYRARHITLDDARERAARGAAYLDEVFPGWYRKIDRNRLDLGNCRACILGQLYGTFANGLIGSDLVDASTARRAGLSPVHFGFLAVQGVCEALQEQDYENLNQAWLEAIEKRQRIHRLTVLPPFIELSVCEPTFVN